MKKLALVLSLLLIISIGFNISNVCKENQRNDISIEGTFLYSPVEGYSDISRDAYLVFDDEGKYVFYHQGNDCIDRGTYELDGNLVQLVSDEGVKKIAYFENDSIFCEIEGETVKAERNSDVPTYINFKH